MKLLVGLGNPDYKYLLTRHNMGFWAADALADKLKVGFSRKCASGVYAEASLGEERVIIGKPTTYMNSSGIFVREIMRKRGIDIHDVGVFYDDMDLPTGKLRVRMKGGAGSHNGMKSIIEQTGSGEFVRFRVGIGEPPVGVRGMDFVLAKPAPQDRELLSATTDRAAEAALTWIREDIDAAMRGFNI